MYISFTPSVIPPVLTTVSLFSMHEQKLADIKEAMAEIACLLVEDPEENVSLVHLTWQLYVGTGA